jgi:D-3-phosphoglycerate dehydrogenase
MPEKPPRIVIVDRLAWYRPVIEQEELASLGADLVVGWAETNPRPEAADRGRPASDEECEQLSRISSAFVPPATTTEDEVIRMAADADAILVVRASITARVMDALPRLRVIGRYGVGVDNIDVEAARERGIGVVNAPGFCAREVADHTMMLLLACSRRLGFLEACRRAGRWARDDAGPIRALFSQTVGLIGFGQIGRQVARRAQAFDLEVLVHDPMVGADEPGVRVVPLDELLASSDFVSLHLPLTAESHHLIGARELARMRPTAFIINTSLGPLIDETALITALQEKRLAGAGLDVFEAEPLPLSSPLRENENVVITPHVGGLSNEGQELGRHMVAGGVAEILRSTPAR